MPDPLQPGSITKQDFEMRFLALTDEEAAKIDEDMRAKHPDRPAEWTKGLIAAICHGWRDVEDEDGAAVPFLADTLRAQSAFSWFRDGVVDAYRQAMTGQAARLGN